MCVGDSRVCVASRRTEKDRYLGVDRQLFFYVSRREWSYPARSALIPKPAQPPAQLHAIVLPSLRWVPLSPRVSLWHLQMSYHPRAAAVQDMSVDHGGLNVLPCGQAAQHGVVNYRCPFG